MTADLNPPSADLSTTPSETRYSAFFGGRYWDVTEVVDDAVRARTAALLAENEALTARATAAEAALARTEANRDAVLADLHEAEAALAAATASLRSISATVSWEINPSNYTHDEVCKLNASWIEIGGIADSALESNPAAQDRENALIAATLEAIADKAKSELAAAWAADLIGRWCKSLAAQPQTDALAARDAKMRAEGMRKAAEWHDGEIKRLEAQIANNNAYSARSGRGFSAANAHCRDGITKHVFARDAILSAAQKEAEA